MTRICYALIELSFAIAQILVAFIFLASFTNFIKLALQIYLQVQSHAQIYFAHEKDCIGFPMQVMYRILGKAKLSYDELQEMMLDVEITLNNFPLSYIEEDVQIPLLAPNMMLLSHQNALLESKSTRRKTGICVREQGICRNVTTTSRRDGSQNT